MSQSNREQLRRNQAAQAQQKRLTRIIGVGAAVLVVVLVGVFVAVLFQNQSRPDTTAAGTPPNATASKDGIVVNPGKATAGAPVVELFFDYQCPVCKQFEGIYGASLKSLAASGAIELHYRNMTFLDNNLNNDASLRAGIGAACSDFAGKYSAYHDEIYANQPANEGDGYTDEMLSATIPATVGITGADLTTFQACYKDKTTKAFVQGMNDSASKSGVNATPSFHVNGKDLSLQTIAGVQPDGLGDLIKQNA
ncbi:MAG TPA: thioredoxin domain-containing protein [Propionicimonas sp.]|nr:thioredoxin domain-containing protein [Propionicimonas sp.]